MKRFNSPEHLAKWRATGRYPLIHDAMSGAAASLVCGSRLLDLGCSYGLLGARIAYAAGGAAFGIDADADVIAAANEARVPIKLRCMRVTADTMKELCDFVAAEGITVLIARRVMPELFGEGIALGVKFAAMLAGAGVDEVLIEGRVVSARSVSALASIDDEVAMLSGSYREVRRIKAISYLRRI
jgi:SAM-dependent methyltransferase